MICEPNYNLPQSVDLKTIRKQHKTTSEVKKEWIHEENFKHILSHKHMDYNILPLFKDQFGFLNDILSLHSNDYLACRWNTFLNTEPKNYIRIRLYVDYKEKLERHFVRRKLLNGNFYGVDNKLAPVPQLKDPRNYTKKIGYY